jgi:hypothetical protein
MTKYYQDLFSKNSKRRFSTKNAEIAIFPGKKTCVN